MKFEIVKTETESGKRWHARIRDDHGMVFWTKDYETEQGAKDACDLVKANAASAGGPGKSIEESDNSPVI
jgi:uncharacterized protein YegP (UPF0339 family)